jgi:hypothetical protein
MMVWFNNKNLVVFLRWLVVQFTIAAFVKKLTCVRKTYYIKLSKALIHSLDTSLISRWFGLKQGLLF